ncbi:hypothetical protein PVAP13_6NG218803 [Panicum virgatum]|uniref:Uncharacterized protein n=1 Tax=Panicum virgatum TaxID=38727 RepID=A0A8T0R0R6_PANVG|nr:hypothetical protein PVAP13_6NG218803 [Panicum virgatum]
MAMSLEEILCQAVEQLGYYSTESGPAYTREGLYQSSYEFRTMPDPTAEPMFTVYGKALPRTSEAKDSCLIRALIFIDDALGYKIGDLNYVQYLLLRNNIP